MEGSWPVRPGPVDILARRPSVKKPMLAASEALKPKVVMVLDDYIVARSLHALLSLKEYETVGIATDATEALALAENTEPDVAITDDGNLHYMSCAKVLQQQMALPAICFLCPENQDCTATLPSRAFLVKPILTLQLIQAVHAILRRRRGLLSS